MTADDVLAHIARASPPRTTYKNLLKQLDAGGDQRHQLLEHLDTLVDAGRLIEERRRLYRLPGPNHFTGRFSLHPKGFGFISPDRRLRNVDGDVFVNPRNTGDGMHGDRVLAELLQRGDDASPEGRIVRALQRTNRTLVGTFEYSSYGCKVIPFNHGPEQWVEVEPGGEIPSPSEAAERLGDVIAFNAKSAFELNGMVVSILLTRFPTPSTFGRGRIVEVLGKPDDFGIDVEITIRKYQLPHRFPNEVRAEVLDVSSEIPESEIARRRDFRRFPIVTIDGESARDFDDAVHVERLRNGNFALQVHVADVSHYVDIGGAIDREARLRGTSVYFPDRAVPMLPVELSTDICSLRPDVDRLVMSAILEIDKTGKTVGAEFCEGVIHSAARMTYTNVYRVLTGDEQAVQEFKDLAGGFSLMEQLALTLNKRRTRRGALDLDMPEPEILFDDQHRMTGVRRADRNVANRIIEEFMLAANEAVAGFLHKCNVPAIYRVHDRPTSKRVIEFEEIARQFGYTLGIKIPAARNDTRRRGRPGYRDKPKRGRQPESTVEIRAKDFQHLLEKLKGQPEERILTYRMLRSLKQARYRETNDGHFALASDRYTHFTSPIRRYPDLICHRVLRASLNRQTSKSPYGEAGAAGPYRALDVQAIADETSLTERRAADAERSLVDWKKAQFMRERLGDHFDATVLDSGEWGLAVELKDLFIEGRIPMDSFGPDQARFRPRSHSVLITKSGTEFGLGDPIRVQLDRVSYDDLRPEFSWVSGHDDQELD